MGVGKWDRVTLDINFTEKKQKNAMGKKEFGTSKKAYNPKEL